MSLNNDNAPTTAYAMLEPYLHVRINYLVRRSISAYKPSCLMMDYIVHIMNDFLSDHFYFKREVPHYYPYILRLYYGVVFWIQCLRANHETHNLNGEQYRLLMRFLDNHSLESMPVAFPLLPLFQTLCCSAPENKSYGFVYPTIPANAGPARRDAFMREATDAFFLPNIPGIFALLENLNTLGNGDPPLIPTKNSHTPVTENAAAGIVFGHYKFPVLTERTNFERYALCSPGLQYQCEADRRLNESFAESYSTFDFPPTAAHDDLRPISKFLHMNESTNWFSQVKLVASDAANFFTGSGTLADCSPSGVMSNQYVVAIQAPSTRPEPPRFSADRRALFPFALRLFTTVTYSAPLVESMAAMAQTHIQMYPTHPYLGTFGHPVGTGPFWAIRPIERSPSNEYAYLALHGCIKDLLKRKHS